MVECAAYLAGPDLFYPDANDRYVRLRALCARHGLEGIAPVDSGPEGVVASVPEDGWAAARQIYQGNLQKLRDASCVLANLTPFRGCEPDSGTVVEVTVAVATGKPVVAYVGDELTVLERLSGQQTLQYRDGKAFDSEGCLVEDFGLSLNLMLAVPVPMFRTPEEAVPALKNLVGRVSHAQV